MGRWYSRFTEAVWEMIAREEWLGCWHVASPMLDIPRSTPLWAQRILFFDFQDIYIYIYICIYIKNHVNIYIYIAVFKSIRSNKRILVVFDLVLVWWGSENVFNRPWASECNNYTTDDFHEFYTIYMILCYVLITISEIWLKLLVYSIMN